MDLALEQARNAALRGEIPVGAVVTDASGAVIAVAGNRTEERQSPAAHAELLAMQDAAAARGQKYLANCTLTVTLEPCAMCAGAIAAFRVKKLVFAHATTHHKPEVIGGVRDSECAALLAQFFTDLRNA